MLAGFTHEPVIELSEQLAALTGHALGHAFYASDGASAVEIAMKMSFHYWRNSGFSSKQEFVCLQGSYHGETIGALSVTDVPLFKDAYGPLLRASHVVASPDARHAIEGESAPGRGAPCDQGCRTAVRRTRESHRRDHRRTAGAVRDRHGDARSALPDTAARTLRPPPGAPDRRRDRGRLRPHRHLLRLRAGRHLAGLSVPVERHQRRLSTPVAGAEHRRHLPVVLQRRHHARLSALALLHRQCAGLPRRAGDLADLPRGRRLEPQPRAGDAS